MTRALENLMKPIVAGGVSEDSHPCTDSPSARDDLFQVGVRGELTSTRRDLTFIVPIEAGEDTLQLIALVEHSLIGVGKIRIDARNLSQRLPTPAFGDLLEEIGYAPEFVHPVAARVATDPSLNILSLRSDYIGGGFRLEKQAAKSHAFEYCCFSPPSLVLHLASDQEEDGQGPGDDCKQVRPFTGAHDRCFANSAERLSRESVVTRGNDKYRPQSKCDDSAYRSGTEVKVITVHACLSSVSLPDLNDTRGGA